MSNRTTILDWMCSRFWKVGNRDEPETEDMEIRPPGVTIIKTGPKPSTSLEMVTYVAPMDELERVSTASLNSTGAEIAVGCGSTSFDSPASAAENPQQNNNGSTTSSHEEEGNDEDEPVYFGLSWLKKKNVRMFAFYCVLIVLDGIVIYAVVELVKKNSFRYCHAINYDENRFPINLQRRQRDTNEYERVNKTASKTDTSHQQA